MNRKLTITFPYYNNPEMLEVQLKNFNRYCDFKHEVEVVIVDDGSSKPAADVIRNSIYKSAVPLHLFRIEEDIAWNHGGARNLAFTHAKKGWVWMNDVNHVVPYKTVKQFFKMEVDPKCVYTPQRQKILPNGYLIKYNPPCGIFILTKKMYWRIGGYDERFRGYYNGMGRIFRKELKRKTRNVQTDLLTILYESDVVEDSTTKLGRQGSEYDISNNPELQKLYNQSLKEYTPGDQLQFKWQKIEL